MGAYKYVQEVYRKKQSDTIRFLQRVRCWYYRQLNAVHRAPRPTRPEKARRLGFKAKQGNFIYYMIYRVCSDLFILSLYKKLRLRPRVHIRNRAAVYIHYIQYIRYIIYSLYTL